MGRRVNKPCMYMGKPVTLSGKGFNPWVNRTPSLLGRVGSLLKCQ